MRGFRDVSTKTADKNAAFKNVYRSCTELDILSLMKMRRLGAPNSESSKILRIQESLVLLTLMYTDQVRMLRLIISTHTYLLG
jgi:hypothetical protein